MARTLGTYQLRHPIVIETKAAEGGAVTEEELKAEGFTVVLRRPKAKDMLVFDRHGNNLVAATTEMIARVSNLDSIEVDNLDGEDWEELGNLLAPTKAGLATGGTGSAT